MVKWSEPTLIEYEFRFGAKRRLALARLGFPRLRKGDREWSCAFQILGLKAGEVRLARGVDGLQALVIANAQIRKSLDRLEPIATNGEAHELVFPRVVTDAYGLEFHRSLCELMDEEIKKRRRRISRQLRARKKPT